MEQETEQPTVDASPAPEQESPASRRKAIARKAAKARWGKKKASKFSSASKKRALGPTSKLFGKALNAAEDRLAAAIQKRAFHTHMTAALDAEIPSLVQTIRALKNTQEPQIPAPATTAATRLASTMRPSVSPVEIAIPQNEQSYDEEEDQFLRESSVAGGNWR